jgi:hypothetical protein
MFTIFIESLLTYFAKYVILYTRRYAGKKAKFKTETKEPKTMRKYENVDIIAVLGAITAVNTAHYTGDFRRDVQEFKKAADAAAPETGNFYWFSRRSGTELYRENELLLKKCEAHNACVYHAENSRHDNYLAYAVEITGKHNGRVTGNLYEVDIVEKGDWFKKNALPVESVILDGDSERRIPYDEYDRLSYRELKFKYGEYKTINYEVSDANKKVLASLIDLSRDIDRRYLVKSEFALKPDEEYLKKLEIGTADYDFPGEREDGVTSVSVEEWPYIRDYHVIDAVYYSDGCGFGFGETDADGEHKYCVWETDAKDLEHLPKCLKKSGDAYEIAGEYTLAANIYSQKDVTKISKAEFENYLKSAEMALEDDYGMIDGVINNGKREEPAGNKGILVKLADIKAQNKDNDAPAREDKAIGRAVTER